MNLKECQRFSVSRFEPRAGASSFGGILLSVVIMGIALIVITIFASFALFDKNLIK
jgi:hypothetical protein